MSGILNKIGSRSGKIWAGSARAAAAGGGGGASTFTAVADGAITAGDECVITSAGKLKKVASSSADVFFGPSTQGLLMIGVLAMDLGSMKSTQSCGVTHKL